MVIEVFADVVCPFTHIGLKRLVEERSRVARNDVHLRICAWPLEVVNAKPVEAEFIAEEIEAISGQVDGDYFPGFSVSSFPDSSIGALALASAGYGVDDPTGEAISLELRRQLFNEGVNIADPQVLAGIAGRHGVSFDEHDVEAHTAVVMGEYERGKERGVIGSPHFFTERDDYFCPALKIQRDSAGQLEVASDPVEFGSFLRDCMGDLGQLRQL